MLEISSWTRLFAAAGSGALVLAVGLGAFGAHALKSRLSAESLAVWGTAVQYHAWHGLGLLVIALVAHVLPEAVSLRWAGCLMTAGIALFSGSLYVLILTDARWLGTITPFGGGAFIAAWILVLYSVMNSRGNG
ncbi:MAG: DUF423 domain-containing protein [Candidatus Latescibacterota bacterium]|nr:DUF423 domain-containing protein [Candidatus Latescibacterota bacterium]